MFKFFFRQDKSIDGKNNKIEVAMYKYFGNEYLQQLKKIFNEIANDIDKIEKIWLNWCPFVIPVNCIEIKMQIKKEDNRTIFRSFNLLI